MVWIAMPYWSWCTDGNDDALIPFQSQSCDSQSGWREGEGTILMILLCQDFQSFNEYGTTFTELMGVIQ
jgi:hypothetical protein